MIGRWAAVVILSLASHGAPTQAAEWQSPAGDMRMKTISGVPHPFVLTLAGTTIECQVVDWPVTEPVGKLGCSDGSTHTIELLDKHTMKVDGALLSSGAR